MSFRSDPRVSGDEAERVRTTWTPDSMVFFGQVWEETTSSSAGRRSGNGQTDADGWGYPNGSQDLGEHTAQDMQTLVCISSFPGLKTSRRMNKPSLRTPSAPLVYCPPSTQPALGPASNLCTEQHQRLASSPQKWQKIAKTTRWERWRSGSKENWNHEKDGARFSLLSARRRYLDKGFI